MEVSSKVLLGAVAFSVVLTIGITAYLYLGVKDYNFVVEAHCEPSEQTCFYRDCSTGECPPNELEYYRVFEVRSGDFKNCSDNSCLYECENEKVSCEEVICSDQEDGNCVTMDNQQVTNPMPVVIPETYEVEAAATSSATSSEQYDNETEKSSTTTAEITVEN